MRESVIFVSESACRLSKAGTGHIWEILVVRVCASVKSHCLHLNQCQKFIDEYYQCRCMAVSLDLSLRCIVTMSDTWTQCAIHLHVHFITRFATRKHTSSFLIYWYESKRSASRIIAATTKRPLHPSQRVIQLHQQEVLNNFLSLQQTPFKIMDLVSSLGIREHWGRNLGRILEHWM